MHTLTAKCNDIQLKTAKIIYLELWQTASKFQQRICGFSTTGSLRKVSSSVATTTDNRRWRQKRLHSHFWLLVVVAIVWKHCRLLVAVENHRFAVGILMISVTQEDISTSDLGGRIAISGCWSKSQFCGHFLWACRDRKLYFSIILTFEAYDCMSQTWV